MQEIRTKFSQVEPVFVNDNNPQNWYNHIILCGVNNLAYRISEQLLTVNIRVVVLDDEPEERLVRLLEKRGVLVLREDSRTTDALERAGIRKAAAVITVENDDLHNLETVLAANEIVPGIRTVASFFNQQIGKQLVSTVKNSRSVSLSEKAGPAFVSAALPSRLLNIFKVKVRHVVETIAVAQLTIDKAGTLEALYPKLTMLALQTDLPAFRNPAGENEPSTAQFIACPPKSTQVKPGDRVTVIGFVEDMKKLEAVHLTRTEIEEAERILNIDSDKPVSMRARQSHKVGRVKGVVASIFRQVGRPFRYALLGLLLVVFFGTFVFHQFYNYVDPSGNPGNMDWITAFYFTITIITTTGFGDFNLSLQEWPLKIFGIIMMLSGTTTFAVMFAFLTNALISLRLDQELGRNQATELTDHVVLCGLGTVGYKTLMGLLERGEQVVVIERNTNDRFNPQVRALGVPIIQADARLREGLQSANLSKARCIAIMTSDDLANLETALAAVSLKHDIRIVLRLFDRNLADKIERNFNIHIALSASSLAAPAFIAEAFNYEQLSTFYIGRVPFTAAQEVVQVGSQLSGLTVGTLQSQVGVQVMAHLRQPISKLGSSFEGSAKVKASQDFLELADDLEPTMHPPAHLLLNQSDTIIFIGPYDCIIKVHQLNTAGGTLTRDER